MDALTHVSDWSEFQIGVALAVLGNFSRTTHGCFEKLQLTIQMQERNSAV
jgi:hypothetical protein